MIISGASHYVNIGGSTMDTRLRVEGAYVSDRGQLYVKGISDHGYITMDTDSGTTKEAGIRFNKDGSLKWNIRVNANSSDLAFNNGSTSVLVLASTGLTITGTTVGDSYIQAKRLLVEGSSTVSVSGSATAIQTVSTTVGGFCMVMGDNGTHGFADLVWCPFGQAPVVINSSTGYGTPAARTYTFASGSLKVSLASGTYNVRAARFDHQN